MTPLRESLKIISVFFCCHVLLPVLIQCVVKYISIPKCICNSSMFQYRFFPIWFRAVKLLKQVYCSKKSHCDGKIVRWKERHFSFLSEPFHHSLVHTHLISSNSPCLWVSLFASWHNCQVVKWCSSYIPIATSFLAWVTGFPYCWLEKVPNNFKSTWSFFAEQISSLFFFPPPLLHIKGGLFILIATDGLMTDACLKFSLKFHKSVLSVAFYVPLETAVNFNIFLKLIKKKILLSNTLSS